MRSINLLKVAAEAELLRLRALLARQGRRAAFGAVAVIFMLGVLVLAEVAGWQVLRLYVASISATLILLGINFVICRPLRRARSAVIAQPCRTGGIAGPAAGPRRGPRGAFLYRGRSPHQRASGARAPPQRASAIGVSPA